MRNLLTIFQELKVEIDDMLRVALEKYPRDKALLEVQEWMNRLVNRMRSDSPQSVDDNSMQTLFLILMIKMKKQLIEMMIKI